MRRNAARIVISIFLLVPGIYFGQAPHTAHAAAGGSTLSPGETLSAGQSIYSLALQGQPGGQYHLDMQSDGNLVLYVAYSRRVLWALSWDDGGNTVAGSYVKMQSDGNLVVYPPTGPAVWSLLNDGVSMVSGSYLSLQGDSNLVVYPCAGCITGAVWNQFAHHGHMNNTLAPSEHLNPGWYIQDGWGKYRLTQQVDGNLVYCATGLYSGYQQPIWQTATTWSGSGGDYTLMQTDGNLVVMNAAGTVPQWWLYQYTQIIANSTLNMVGNDDIWTVTAPGGGLVYQTPWENSCGTGRQVGSVHSLFSGGYQNSPSGPYGGIQAQITNELPYVSSAAGDSVSGWVMLQTTGNGAQFSQMGWYAANGTVHAFGESWGGALGGPGGTPPNGNTSVHHEYGSVTPGQASYYSVQTTQNGTFTFWLNGAYEDQMYSGLTFNSGDVVVETHNTADELAAWSADRQYMTSAQLYYGGSWQPFGWIPQGQLVIDEPYYGFEQSSSTSVDMWDEACGT